jgi:hypothetical protein
LQLLLTSVVIGARKSGGTVDLVFFGPVGHCLAFRAFIVCEESRVTV